MLAQSLGVELSALRVAGLYRRLRHIEHLGPCQALVDGRKALLFASNDYLGLASHPDVVGASVAAARSHGCGATASRLVNGNHALYRELEDALAEFKGTEAALVFPTGYMANLGVVTALAHSRSDAIHMDRLNHASLYDAAAMAPATLTRYAHGDVGALAANLEAGPCDGRRLIVTDGVFSMDGDSAPLAELAELAHHSNAVLVVDDAHGTGVLGPDGRGSCAAAGVHADVEIGTLSKALGSVGGFVAGSRALVDYLINRARPLVFSTGLPPAAIASSTAALRVARTESWRRARVLELSANVRRALVDSGFEIVPGDTPIIPIIIGDESAAVAFSDHLLEQGIFIPAIRTPSVEKGRARLRMTLSAEHTDEQIARALELLDDARSTVVAP